MEEEHRPWGYYQILSNEDDHKVKRIIVYPEKRFSLQKHKKRDEHWYVITGTALVTLNDDEVKVREGESVNIKRGTLHRVMNQADTNLVFIEVQTGEYFGEDDIERIEDDFGRI